jgi:hypothetical protein
MHSLPSGVTLIEPQPAAKLLPIVRRCPGMGAGCGRPISANKRLCLAHQMELDQAKAKFLEKQLKKERELAAAAAEEWRKQQSDGTAA